MESVGGVLEKFKTPTKKKRHLPTLGHALADEIEEYFKDGRYSLYLVFVKKHGHQFVREKFEHAKKADVDSRAKLFMWSMSAKAIYKTTTTV
jgi:hypothetical protein